MSFILGLDCIASESLFFIHVMDGMGEPWALQFKVTLKPATTVWFFGSSTVSGAWKADTDNPRWQWKMCWENIIKNWEPVKNIFGNWGWHIKQEKGSSTNKKRGLSRFRHLGIALSFLHLQSILHMLLHFLLSMLLGRYLRVLLLKAGFHWRRS